MVAYEGVGAGPGPIPAPGRICPAKPTFCPTWSHMSPAWPQPRLGSEEYKVALRSGRNSLQASGQTLSAAESLMTRDFAFGVLPDTSRASLSSQGRGCCVAPSLGLPHSDCGMAVLKGCHLKQVWCISFRRNLAPTQGHTARRTQPTGEAVPLLEEGARLGARWAGQRPWRHKGLRSGSRCCCL